MERWIAVVALCALSGCQYYESPGHFDFDCDDDIEERFDGCKKDARR